MGERRKKFVAARAANNQVAADWYVREETPGGASAWIVCYCYGELRAKEIERALNLLDAVETTLEGNRS